MSRDLESQLAEYGGQLRSDLPVLDSDEVMFRGESSVLVGGERDKPPMTPSGVAVVAAVFVAVLGFGLLQSMTSGPSEVADSVTPAFDLGVFEPIRGWIIYPSGGDLEAVNPDNPSERVRLDLPIETGWSVPVGWSADGSLLALENEKAGSWSVMDRFGDFPLHGPTSGCCLFVASNWLSPDGASIPRLALGRTHLAIDNHSNVEGPGFLDLSEIDGVSGFRDVTWSPDGRSIAVVAEKDRMMEVVVVDVETGAVREVADSTLQYIRHIAWSPDGTQVLATSADLTPDPGNPPTNPLVNPIQSQLYLVDVGGSGRREIASGHYVAAVWSPDGARIAALDYNSEGRRIVIMDADGGGQTVLRDVIPSGPFTGLAWHPAP